MTLERFRTTKPCLFTIVNGNDTVDIIARAGDEIQIEDGEVYFVEPDGKRHLTNQMVAAVKDQMAPGLYQLEPIVENDG